MNQDEFGDCLLLQSSDGSNSISILIDGSPSQTCEKNLKPTLDTVLPSKKIDLAILSHIDNDHVLGLLDLFEAIKTLDPFVINSSTYMCTLTNCNVIGQSQLLAKNANYYHVLVADSSVPCDISLTSMF
jgi:beta-lactamase superfamily II metal-dependent hydrolase